MKLIEVDLRLQVMVCTVCGEPLEIRRNILDDQHALLELEQATQHDHRECAVISETVFRARRDRAYRKRMERELQRQEQRERSARTRCQGRTRG